VAGCYTDVEILRTGEKLAQEDDPVIKCELKIMWKTPLQELNITETEVPSEGIKDRLEDFDLQTYMQFIPELTEEQKKEIEKE
jgi:hypothetical protein